MTFFTNITDTHIGDNGTEVRLCFAQLKIDNFIKFGYNIVCTKNGKNLKGMIL